MCDHVKTKQKNSVGVHYRKSKKNLENFRVEYEIDHLTVHCYILQSVVRLPPSGIKAVWRGLQLPGKYRLPAHHLEEQVAFLLNPPVGLISP